VFSGYGTAIQQPHKIREQTKSTVKYNLCNSNGTNAELRTRATTRVLEQNRLHFDDLSKNRLNKGLLTEAHLGLTKFGSKK
jgi:hypothetical protein